jgi:hypothetical protein
LSFLIYHYYTKKIFLCQENFFQKILDKRFFFWYNIFIKGVKNKKMTKLDYSLQTPEERKELVEKILDEAPDPSEQYLESLADYLILCMEKQERKEKKILTDNRMVTVNKRETSFEGLVSQFENGEDGIYALITNDKNTIFQPKISITKQDVEEIPFLKQLRETIAIWEKLSKTAVGKQAYVIKKALIDMRKEQYIIKNAYRVPVTAMKINHSKTIVPLEDKTCRLDENGYPIPEGISLLDPKVCEAILQNYSKLKEDSWDHFDSDTWYLMQDFDKVAGEALKPFPLYERIVEYKVDGKQNVEIQQLLQEEFGIKHSIEYISSLWCNKIPKLIASAAEDEWLEWYYTTQEKGKYKKCSRCGQIKLAHNKYFSKNKTSRDGFYSICKSCRNQK